MTDRTPPAQLALGSRAEEMFPTLTEAQVARIAAHGRVRQVQPGEVLVQAGERTLRFFVVTAGLLELVHWTGGTEEIVAVFQRVASAVGEGSIAIAFVHQVLHE